MNDIPVQGKTASEVHELIQSHKGCSLVLAVMKSPPVLSPMTPSASLPGSFVSQNVRNKPQMNSSLMTGGQGSTAPTPFNFPQMKSPPPPPTLRDESAQTSTSTSTNDGTNGFSPPKKESFIDRVREILLEIVRRLTFDFLPFLIFRFMINFSVKVIKNLRYEHRPAFRTRSLII